MPTVPQRPWDKILEMSHDYPAETYEAAASALAAAEDVSLENLAIFLWARPLAFLDKSGQADSDLEIASLSHALRFFAPTEKLGLTALAADYERKALSLRDSVSPAVAFWSNGKYACEFFLKREDKLILYAIDVFIGLTEEISHESIDLFQSEVQNIFLCLAGTGAFGRSGPSKLVGFNQLATRAASAKFGSDLSLY
jgi:hypothetical protein